MPKAFRADHVGSLLRPPEVMAARERYAAGQLDLAGLRAVEDRHILEALELQRQAGVDVFTDGEYRRGSWQSDMAEAVDGFVREHMPIEWHGPNAAVEGSTAHVVGERLRKRQRLTGHESGFLKAHAPGPCKITMPPPSVFLIKSYRPGLTDKVYSREELLNDLVSIVGDEVEALVQEGVDYIQIDSPEYARLLDARTREEIERSGITLQAALDMSIKGDSACMRRSPRLQTIVALHICRGNSRSRWFGEGGYEPIAEQLFSTMDVDRFLLEYDTERAGGFEPLRFVPDGKMVVLGLITTKQAALESQDMLRRRIDEAVKYHPLEQMAISPQCGFASTAAGNLLTPDEQRRKLELVAETARLVWG
ncbi:MAG TPA: cobalamin-independent methionine synthase II family protein [Chloroflexota bacterium]